MPLAEKGVRGKGRQPLSPPQPTVTPEREQRFGLQLRISASSPTAKQPDRSTGTYALRRFAGG